MLRIILIIIIILVAVPFYNMVRDNTDKLKLGVEVIQKVID